MQILNKLKTVFNGMVHDALYSYLDGDKYIQVSDVSGKASSPMVSPLGIGFKMRQGFLKNTTIINNLQVLDTLLKYSTINNALIVIKPSVINKNVWKSSVYVAGMKVFSAEIRFSDDYIWETQLLKWKFSIR